MHETATTPTTASAPPGGLETAASRAEAWSGEPFVHPDEDPEVALAPGTARREALDDALAEMEAGLPDPSASWKVRYALMLGLERVLNEDPVRTASGTELRRHQVDALAGMLTELIASRQRAAEENGNGPGTDNGGGNGTVVDGELEASSRTSPTTTSTPASSTRRRRSSSTTGTTRERRVGTGSATRRPPERRSRQPGSWRRLARSAF